MCALPPRVSVRDRTYDAAPVAAGDGVGVRASQRSRYYFSCISFDTDFTPPTVLATSTARLMSSRELTKPLNWAANMTPHEFEAGGRLRQQSGLEEPPGRCGGVPSRSASYIGCPVGSIAELVRRFPNGFAGPHQWQRFWVDGREETAGRGALCVSVHPESG
jgi:hypothetical protein